jgi:hypothetical protein
MAHRQDEWLFVPLQIGKGPGRYSRGGRHAMSKAIKGNAGRKPPEPSANHSDIDDWCRRLMPDLQPIVKRLDESIRATVRGLDYAVKWKRAYYGLPELGWVIEIAAYDVSVNVVFLGGADFESPPVRAENAIRALRPAL